MPEIKMTNMVMIQDAKTGNVLVQNRVKNFKGLAFPGGHIENNESIVDSAAREVKEETGLDVQNLKSCGLVHWLNNKTFDRYLVFLFRTSDYSGKLIGECNEGKNFWISIEEMRSTPSENATLQYLPLFLGDKYSEAFGSWSDEGNEDIVYK